MWLCCGEIRAATRNTPPAGSSRPPQMLPSVLIECESAKKDKLLNNLNNTKYYGVCEEVDTVYPLELLAFARAIPLLAISLPFSLLSLPSLQYAYYF